MKKDMLLAPNGKPSNLTAEQYKLVRTPAFKKWFGDWENDPKNASKVVDENGEPKVMWHFAKRLQGKNERFNEFKTDRQLGAHFGSLNQVKNLKYLNLKSDLLHPNIENKDTDYRFYQVFLNIINPTRLKDVGIFDGLTFLDTLGSEIVSNVYSGKYDNDITFKSKGSFLDRIKYVAKITYGFDGAVYLNRYEATDDMNLVNKLDDASDNVFISKVPNAKDSWIAFYPEQIKLADGSNTIFDGSNPDIRFDKGGEVKELINKGIVELKMFDTTTEHAKEYGLQSINPLYIQTISVSEPERLKGLGKKALAYIDKYAIENGHDVVFGHITQKAKFTKDERESYFADIDMIKNWLRSNGYAVNYDNNDFHKVIIKFKQGGKIKTALQEIEKAPSVKYWMQPEFPAESYDYPQKGKPNSFVKMYEDKYNADTILAYDKKGDIVGLFTISKGGDEKGAFKIVVREDSENKGWGKKLLDEAEKQGIDIIGNIKHNSFSHSGRYLLRSWLNKKMEQGGELAMGIKAEMEHKGTIDKFKRAGVSDKDVATSIAKDHLKEDPKYYTKLMKIEEKLALGGALLERKFDVGGNVNIQPIREMGTGANVYFETPFYRVNDNTKDKYILLVGLLNSGGYMYEYTYYYDNLEIPMFVAKELAKIYPNGVPDAVLIDKFVDSLEKKWSGEEENERDSDEDIEIEEKPHHGISTNVGDYKNPYEINRAIERLLDAKGGERELYNPDEINFISYYSGYGGLDKMGTFSDEEIKGLLYEFYTPDEVVQKMWGLAYKYGYGAIGDNSVFEPSVGIGAFLKYAPENVYVAANEINKYSAMICEILYPNVQTTLMPFEKNFISKNLSIRKNIEGLKKYSLIIGNPPYGKLGSKAGIYMPMGEDKYSGAANWAEYFLFRGIDLLQKDGLLIYVIGAEQYNGGSLFLDSPLTKTKKAIFEKADLIDAYRLPNKIFERTGVSSEIVIFRKR